MTPLALLHRGVLQACMTAARDGDSYLAFVLGTALLERVLTELLRVVCAVAGRCPPREALLKDIVASAELRDSLGAGATCTLVAFCSPSCLNARNLVWHGFLRPGELDRSHVSLLLLMLFHAADALRAARDQPARPAPPLPPSPLLPSPLPPSQPLWPLARTRRCRWWDDGDASERGGHAL